MRVIRAEAMGMCFGVRDAIAMTETISDPQSVTIYGELVHNAGVNKRLAERGFQSHSEADRMVPETPLVLVTAHGISNRELSVLQEAGKNVIDATCPLVRRAHGRAMELDRDGWHVVVAGKRDHVEVRGLTGDLHNYTVVENPAEAVRLDVDRIAVVCQTTLQTSVANQIVAALKQCNPHSEVRLFNTICRPTRERQDAMEELLGKCEAIVIVGGNTSNNTKQLVRRAAAAGLPHVHIGCAEELDVTWLQKFQTIGLTAGTSTPDSVIDQVEQLISEVQGATLAGMPRPVLASGVVPSEAWVNWFEWNAANQPDFGWDANEALAADKLSAIAESLQEFQRGESSEGRHFLSRGFAHAMESGDSEYYAALRLFIAEENRHGVYLGRYLTGQGVDVLQATTADNLFRALRRIGGLEGAIRVLITAEVIACPYYLAISRATDSPVLKAICRQILHDEQKHLRFQYERLEIMSEGRWGIVRSAVDWLQYVLLIGAVLCVWPKHGRAIRAGRMGFMAFIRENFRVLNGLAKWRRRNPWEIAAGTNWISFLLRRFQGSRKYS